MKIIQFKQLVTDVSILHLLIAVLAILKKNNVKLVQSVPEISQIQ